MTRCGTCGEPLPHPDVYCEVCCFQTPGTDWRAAWMAAVERAERAEQREQQLLGRIHEVEAEASMMTASRDQWQARSEEEARLVNELAMKLSDAEVEVSRLRADLPDNLRWKHTSD